MMQHHYVNDDCCSHMTHMHHKHHHHCPVIHGSFSRLKHAPVYLNCKNCVKTSQNNTTSLKVLKQFMWCNLIIIFIHVIIWLKWFTVILIGVIMYVNGCLSCVNPALHPTAVRTGSSPILIPKGQSGKDNGRVDALWNE